MANQIVNQFDDETAKKVHKLHQDLAHFVALYEQTDDKLKIQKQETQQSLDDFKTQVKEQLQEISEIMSETGAARWRIEAQRVLSQGEEHLTAMRECCNNFQQYADAAKTQLEELSNETEKRITRTLSKLSDENSQIVDDFQRHMTESYDYVATVANNAAKIVKKTVGWFRWDRIMIAVIAALVASLLTSAYVNAEWPWESNQRAIKERQIGRDVMTTWPTLTKNEQDEVSRVFGLHIA